MKNRLNISLLFVLLISVGILIILHWKASENKAGLYEHAASRQAKERQLRSEDSRIIRNILPRIKEPLTFQELIELIEKSEFGEYWTYHDREIGYGNFVFKFGEDGIFDTYLYNPPRTMDIYRELSVPPSTSYIFGKRKDYPIVGANLFSFLLILLYFLGIITYITAEVRKNKKLIMIHSQQIMIMILFLTFCSLFYYIFNNVFTISLYLYVSAYIPLEFAVDTIAHILVFPSFLMDFILIVFISVIWIEYRKNNIELSGGS